LRRNPFIVLIANHQAATMLSAFIVEMLNYKSSVMFCSLASLSTRRGNEGEAEGLLMRISTHFITRLAN